MAVSYATAVFDSYSLAVDSTADVNDTPDKLEISGIIKLSPLWDYSSKGFLIDGGRAVHIKIFPVDVKAGKLVTKQGDPFVKFPVQVGTNAIPWKVEYDLNVGDERIGVKSITINPTPGQTINLVDGSIKA